MPLILLPDSLLDDSHKFIYNFVDMLTSQTLKTITDMRKSANHLLRLVSTSKEPVGILKNNKLEAYLIDARLFEALEEFIEDYLDEKMVRERLENATKDDFVELKDFLPTKKSEL